jgi:hypothetical protein
MDEGRHREDAIGTATRLIVLIRDTLLLLLILGGAFLLRETWPALRSGLRHATVDSLSLGAISLRPREEPVAAFSSTALTVEAVGGPAEVLEKGSPELLEAIENSGSGRIELLGLSPEHTYSGELLLAYITRLSPRFVIYRRRKRLEAWGDTGTVAAQISAGGTYSYERLTKLRGLRREHIEKDASARQALDLRSRCTCHT